MEDITVILLAGMVMLTVVASIWMVKSWKVKEMETKKAVARARNIQTGRFARSVASGETTGVASWVSDLLEEFGVSPDVLLEEEMPDELARLVPMAKAFVSGGGLSKFLSGTGTSQTDNLPPEGRYV